MNVEGDGFCMELARMLSFSDVLRILRGSSDVQLPGDIPSSEPIESVVSEEDSSIGESNNSQFTRLPRAFERSFSEANKIQCLKTLCDYASQPEDFYSSLSTEQWLRTVVNCKSKDALLLLRSGDFSEQDFTIQCHVVPCEPYWEKLRRARSSVIDNCKKAGASSKGVYFSSSSLENDLFQLTRDDQQEYNVLKHWIERYGSGREEMIPRRLRREIKPSDGELKGKALSPRLLETNLGRFQLEVWRGGLFGVKVFREVEKKIFLNEVKVLEAIGTHPHIVHSFGVSIPEGEDGFYKYWMEKLDSDLDVFLLEWGRLSEDSNIPTPFSVIDSMNVLLQIAKAMTRLHELDVIHGDLKSGNILISHYEVLGDVNLYIVKVADFDCSKILTSEDEVVNILGTEDCIAPEVRKGRHTRESSSNEESRIPGTPMSGSSAKKCDVYSFGIVAVEVLSGEISNFEIPKDSREDIMKPLKNNGIYESRPDLIGLVDRCLNHDASTRPSFKDITIDLESIIRSTVSLN